jgi:hypothetical protein
VICLCFLVMRSTEDLGDFFEWISWGKEVEDFASLEEVSGEGKKKKKKNSSSSFFFFKKY